MSRARSQMTTLLTDLKTAGAGFVIATNSWTFWAFLSVVVWAIAKFFVIKEQEKEKTERARIEAERDKFVAGQATEQAKIAADAVIRLAEIEQETILALAAPDGADASLQIGRDG